MASSRADLVRKAGKERRLAWRHIPHIHYFGLKNGCPFPTPLTLSRNARVFLARSRKKEVAVGRPLSSVNSPLAENRARPTHNFGFAHVSFLT